MSVHVSTCTCENVSMYVSSGNFYNPEGGLEFSPSVICPVIFFFLNRIYILDPSYSVLYLLN